MGIQMGPTAQKTFYILIFLKVKTILIISVAIANISSTGKVKEGGKDQDYTLN